MQKDYLNLLNGKLIEYRGEIKEEGKDLRRNFVVFTTEFKDCDRGLSLSSIANQIVEESGMDVLVFAGPNQSTAVKNFLKAETTEEPVRIHVS